MTRGRPEISDYEKTKSLFKEFLLSLPDELRPIAAFQHGYVGSPGFSDLDFFLVVEDDYIFGNELFEYIKKFVGLVPHKEILFAHLPYLLPEFLAKKIAEFAFIDPEDLETLYGRLDFSPLAIGTQHLLQQHEFLAERTTIIALSHGNENISLDTVLLLGHSLKHSLHVLSHLMDVDQFVLNGLPIVESIRSEPEIFNDIGKQQDKKALLEKLLKDSFLLLNISSEIIQQKLHLSMGVELYDHPYSENVIWADFSEKPKSLEVTKREEKVFLANFPRSIIILKQLLYGQVELSNCIMDDDLSEAILHRQRIVSDLASFNFLNFGSAFGRGIISSYATGETLNQLCKYLIQKNSV